MIWQMRADRDGEPQLSRKLLDLAVERREFDLDIADDEPVIGSFDYDASHARWAKSKTDDAAVQFGAVIGPLLSAAQKAGIRVTEGTLRRARGGGTTDPRVASDLASLAFRIERLASGVQRGEHATVSRNSRAP